MILMYARSRSRGTVRVLGVYDGPDEADSAWSSSKFFGHPDAERIALTVPDEAVFWDDGEIMAHISTTPAFAGDALVSAIRRVFPDARKQLSPTGGSRSNERNQRQTNRNAKKGDGRESG